MKAKVFTKKAATKQEVSYQFDGDAKDMKVSELITEAVGAKLVPKSTKKSKSKGASDNDQVTLPIGSYNKYRLLAKNFMSKTPIIDIKTDKFRTVLCCWKSNRKQKRR